MSKYNIFQAIYMSFYSRKLYQDVAKNWGGKAFFYLFVLLALSWIAQTYAIQSALTLLYAHESDVFVAQFPALVVIKGKITTPENKPYLIKETGTNKLIAIIEVRIYQLPSAFSATINPVTINGYVKSGIGFAWIFIFIFVMTFSFIFRLIQVLLYSIIGKIFSAITSSKVCYGTILQITIMAITPSIVLATIFDLLRCSLPHQHLVFFILSMFYMCYGIRANKS